MAKKSKSGAAAESAEKVICRNRKATHEYLIVESMEAGLVLTGTEVKSLRAGRASLDNSFARIEGGELWLIGAEIPEYEMGNRMNHLPKRKRKLLLHRHQIKKFAEGTTERGFTMIPLKIYFRDGKAKVEIAIGKGKQLHDKRQTLKEKTARREIGRALGSRRSS